MRRVLVAVDESEGSRRASVFVERFFAGLDVEVRAVNVARSPVDAATWARFGAVYPWPWPSPSGGVSVTEASARADASSRSASHVPAGVDLDVVHGEVVHAICGAAEAIDADLIVVGDNHPGFIERLTRGSTSRKVVEASPQPVLVVS